MSDLPVQRHSNLRAGIPELPPAGRHDMSCVFLCRTPPGEHCKLLHTCARCAQTAERSGRRQFRDTYR